MTCPVCKQEVKNWRTQPPNLLELALHVHMTANGSFERPAEDQERDVAALEAKLKNWEPYGHAGGVAFSEAVRAVLVAAVAEAKGKRWRERNG